MRNLILLRTLTTAVLLLPAAETLHGEPVEARDASTAAEPAPDRQKPAGEKADRQSAPWRTVGDFGWLVRESSGLVASRQFDGVFWTHADSKQAAAIYAVREDGELVAWYRVKGVANLDWEAIAADDEGHLYIGDIGNNLGRYETRIIYRVVEPDLTPILAAKRESEARAKRNSPGDAPATPRRSGRRAKAPAGQIYIEERIEFAYPDGRQNAEAIFHDGSNLYLIPKLLFSRPALYRVHRRPRAGEVDRNKSSAEPVGSTPASDESHEPQTNATLEKVSDLPVRLATGVGLSRDGKRLAVCSYGQLWVFDLKKPRAYENLTNLSPRRVTYPIGPQIEAVAWNGNDLLLTAESGRIYRISAADIEAEQAFERQPRDRERRSRASTSTGNK